MADLFGDDLQGMSMFTDETQDATSMDDELGQDDSLDQAVLFPGFTTPSSSVLAGLGTSSQSYSANDLLNPYGFDLKTPYASAPQPAYAESVSSRSTISMLAGNTGALNLSYAQSDAGIAPRRSSVQSRVPRQAREAREAREARSYGRASVSGLENAADEHSVGAPSEQGEDRLAGHADSCGDGSYRCLVCQVVKKPRSEMVKHVNTHTKPYACHNGKCGKRFATPNDRDRHEQIHKDIKTRDRSFKCIHDKCRTTDKLFTRWDNFKCHLLKLHGITNPQIGTYLYVNEKAQNRDLFGIGALNDQFSTPTTGPFSPEAGHADEEDTLLLGVSGTTQRFPATPMSPLSPTKFDFMDLALDVPSHTASPLDLIQAPGQVSGFATGLGSSAFGIAPSSVRSNVASSASTLYASSYTGRSPQSLAISSSDTHSVASNPYTASSFGTPAYATSVSSTRADSSAASGFAVPAPVTRSLHPVRPVPGRVPLSPVAQIESSPMSLTRSALFAFEDSGKTDKSPPSPSIRGMSKGLSTLEPLDTAADAEMWAAVDSDYGFKTTAPQERSLEEPSSREPNVQDPSSAMQSLSERIANVPVIAMLGPSTPEPSTPVPGSPGPATLRISTPVPAPSPRASDPHASQTDTGASSLRHVQVDPDQDNRLPAPDVSENTAISDPPPESQAAMTAAAGDEDIDLSVPADNQADPGIEHSKQASLLDMIKACKTNAELMEVLKNSEDVKSMGYEVRTMESQSAEPEEHSLSSSSQYSFDLSIVNTQSALSVVATPSEAGNGKLHACTYKGCTATFKSSSNLKKHKTRHEKPFACTHGCRFSETKKPRTFGSKNDWKRHEESVHFIAELDYMKWQCEEPVHDPSNGSVKTCNYVCPNVGSFLGHLFDSHKVKFKDDAQGRRQSVGKLAKARRIPAHKANFWCGFCKTSIPMTQKVGDTALVDLSGSSIGLATGLANEWPTPEPTSAGDNKLIPYSMLLLDRFDHIDMHFVGRKCKQARISEWKSLEYLEQVAKKKAKRESQPTSPTDSRKRSNTANELATPELKKPKHSSSVSFEWKCCKCATYNTSTDIFCSGCSYQRCNDCDRGAIPSFDE